LTESIHLRPAYQLLACFSTSAFVNCLLEGTLSSGLIDSPLGLDRMSPDMQLPRLIA
jgi:hypothetical protein